jgi:hypothetical protein
MASIAGNERFPLLSLFIPETRKHDLNHPLSIMHAIYKAFDHFGFQPDLSSLSINNLLLLPIKYFFSSCPADHWIHRYPYFKASEFFIHDLGVRRLRLRVTSEYIQRPRLCKKLFNEILIHRTVKLHPFLWQYIETDITVMDVDNTADTLVSQFRDQSLWQKFSSTKYRHLNILHTGRISLIPRLQLKRFWSAEMLLQARAI